MQKRWNVCRDNKDNKSINKKPDNAYEEKFTKFDGVLFFDKCCAGGRFLKGPVFVKEVTIDICYGKTYRSNNRSTNAFINAKQQTQRIEDDKIYQGVEPANNDEF